MFFVTRSAALVTSSTTRLESEMIFFMYTRARAAAELLVSNAAFQTRLRLGPSCSLSLDESHGQPTKQDWTASSARAGRAKIIVHG